MASLIPCVLLVLGTALPCGPRLARWFAAGACAAALAILAWRFAIVPEDTFISMRFARHLAAGEGLVYNPGERVEGYTNPLWTVLLAAVHVVGAPPLPSALVLSIAFCAAAAAAVCLVIPRIAGRADAVAWSAAAVVLLPAYWDAAGSGLETAMYTFLVTGGALAHVLALREDRRPGAGTAVLHALAVLTRPEGIFTAGLLCGGSALSRPRDRAWVRRQAVVLATAALVFAAHVLWRRAYYGDWLPNTFYCKVGATAEQVRRGGEQFLQFLRTGNGLLLVPCVLAPWFLRRMPWLLPPLALGVGYTAYVIAIGGDNFWRHRYLVPVLPALLLVSELVAREVAGEPLARLPASARRALGAAALFALWGSVDGIKLQPREDARDAAIESGRRFGVWLTENTPPGRSVAVMAAGVVPYYTDRPVIDMLGLCDRHIARVQPPDAMGTRNAGHEKYDFDYVLAREPEFALMKFQDDVNAPDDLVCAAVRADPTLKTRWLARYEPYLYVDGRDRMWILRRRR